MNRGCILLQVVLDFGEIWTTECTIDFYDFGGKNRGFNFSFNFLAPKMSTVHIGLTEKVPQRRAVCCTTVVNPRFKSQVFDETDVQGVRWWRLLKTAPLYLQRRHLRRCRLRHQLPPSAVPAIFAKLYATTSTSAPQQRMSAIDGRLPT